MKAISKLLSYSDEFLDPKIPAETQYLKSFETDYPFFFAEKMLDPALCDRIVARLLKAGPVGRATVATLQEGEVSFILNEDIRNTMHFALSPGELHEYQKCFKGIQPAIEKFFRVTLKASEGIQALGYTPGCRYDLHCDNCDLLFDDLECTARWVLNRPNRVISTILFLTDSVQTLTGPNQCVGGQVTFDYLLDQNQQPFSIAPKKGLLVAFPSTPYFSHEVHEVTEGFRISIVEWYSADLFFRNI